MYIIQFLGFGLSPPPSPLGENSKSVFSFMFNCSLAKKRCFSMSYSRFCQAVLGVQPMHGSKAASPNHFCSQGCDHCIPMYIYAFLCISNLLKQANFQASRTNFLHNCQKRKEANRIRVTQKNALCFLHFCKKKTAIRPSFPPRISPASSPPLLYLTPEPHQARSLG